MTFRWLADAVVLAHAAFVLFVVFGGFLALRWRWMPWIHVPAALWGVLIEYVAWICPLTPLENALRHRAGQTGYAEGFVEHYVIPVLYPVGLTSASRWVLGTFVVLVNAVAYRMVLRRRRRVAEPMPQAAGHIERDLKPP